MAIPDTNGIFIHNGINCSPAVVPTAQSIPMSPSDSTTVKTELDNKSDLSIIADEYNTSSTYTFGDFVIYDKVLYKCIMYSTTGAWDSTRWVAVNSKDSGINLKNSSGNTLVKIWENNSGVGVITLYDKTTGYDTVSLHGYGDVDAKSITVMTSGQSNSGRIELTTTQSNSGYISLRDDNKNTPIDLNADSGNINAISLNGVTIGSSPKFTDTTYESKTAASGGTDVSLVTTGEKYTWNAKSDTDNKVTQTATTTNASYEVLFSGTADNTTRTEGAGKNSNLTFNPSTGRLTATEVSATNIKATNLNGVAIGSSPQFTDTTYSLGTNGTAIRLSANGTAQNDVVAPAVVGTYSGSGGKQGPGYYGKNRVGFLMSNETVGNNGNYKNWIYMDNYNGNDFGGATAIGVDRTVPRAFIMRSDADRTTWNGKAELGVFTVTPVSGEILVSDGTSGGLKCSGYGTSSITNKLPLAGGTMTGTITLASAGLKTSAASGFTTDGSGNFKHQRTTNTDYWQLISNNGSVVFKYYWETGNLVVPGTITATTTDVSSSLSVSGNLQSVTKKLFKFGNVVELFMTGNVKTAIADNGVFMTVPTGYNPKVNDAGFTFFTGGDPYIPTGMKFGYFTWGGRDFHTLGALSVGTQVTVHITYLI